MLIHLYQKIVTGDYLNVANIEVPFECPVLKIPKIMPLNITSFEQLTPDFTTVEAYTFVRDASGRYVLSE